MFSYMDSSPKYELVYVNFKYFHNRYIHVLRIYWKEKEKKEKRESKEKQIDKQTKDLSYANGLGSQNLIKA